MIRELHIKNLALIEELTLEFDSGFTIFTGETGAGKSILIGAIGLLLGERASTDLIRSGFEEAEVSGVFELDSIKKSFQELLTDLNISVDDGQLIIRRKITRNEKNRILVNQIPVPLGSLKSIGNYLIDFHGQHEHQSLLNEEEHGKIIDNLTGVYQYRFEYDQAYMLYNNASQELEAYRKKSALLTEKKEMLEFQYNELKNLGLTSGEEEKLESELKLLSSSSERIACTSDIVNLLTGDSDSFEKKIITIRKRIENLAKFDPSVESWIDQIDAAVSTFTELETFCTSYLDKAGNGADPDRIEFINSRLARIQRLKKKYNCSLEQLIQKQKELEKDLQSIENSSSDLGMLEKNKAQAALKCQAAGKTLSEARIKCASIFDSKISAIMKTLGFSGGNLTTVMEKVNEPEINGLETICFLVQTNAGEPLLPLAKTASGGEISRIMLAIKSVLAENDQVPVLIFDEIDTGIGGLLASEVGKAMCSLSHSHQVLCISHLHQIASLSDHHYRVYKETSSDRTVTRVMKLDKDNKVKEIARMLGGDSEISLKHARELVENGEQRCIEN